MPLILIAPAIALVLWGLVAWLIRKGRAEYRQAATALEAIGSLPLAEAEQRAYVLLGDVGVFRCVESASVDVGDLESLPDGLRRLLRRYGRVETVAGPPMRLDRGLISASGSYPGYITVGKGLEATDVEFALGVQPGGETLYELHPNEAPDPTFGTYRSVYHWLLAAATEVQAARKRGSRA
jgi:hypothetical protein